MYYTEKELINLHKCSIFKLDDLVHLDEGMIVNIGDETNAMITTNRSNDFSHGIVSKKSLEFYERTLEELNNEDHNFVIDRVHPHTAKKLIPALLKFYSSGDINSAFTDLQIIRRDIDQPFENILTSSKISANGNFITYNLPTSQLGQMGNKMEKELEIGRKFQKNLPAFLSLSKQEKTILGWIAQGFTNIEISERLSVSKHTIRTHKMSIYKKLDISSLREAIKWSITFNLI